MRLDDDGMIWAILALLGVPLWLCALGIFSVVYRNRMLRNRAGDMPVRVKSAGKDRWIRGHAVWISDVFARRGSPAAWQEHLVRVRGITLRSPDSDELKKLRHLAADPVIATVDVEGPESFDVAVDPADQASLMGPFPEPTPAPLGPPVERVD